MVDVDDIPDFPNQPGQRPIPGVPPTVEPVQVVLVTSALDPGYRNIALDRDTVDRFIAAEIAASRAFETTVERWSPWSALQIEIGYAAGAQFNYARFTIGDRSWYAFLDADYLNLTTTLYTPTGDLWTTYSPTIGYSLVQRGHIAVAASQDDTYGDQYLTAPEPIDAEPVRGVLAADILGSAPGDWTVVVVSANDLRGRSGAKPFWNRHVRGDEIMGASGLASSATVDSAGHVITTIPDASYPWTANTSGGGSGGTLVDNISPGHPVTNPGHTFASGWAWHVDSTGGYGGVDLAYNFQTFKAPGAGTVDHFDVAGVGMIVRLTLDTPAQRINPQEPSGHDAYGPIVAIWFEHCSAAIDGHHEQGDVIGTSGDGYGQYAPHLHVHGLTDHSKSAGTANRAQFFSFVGGAVETGPDVYVPAVVESPVSTIDGVSAGGGVYLFTPDGFAEYMTIMQGAPWITSGITDVRLVPSWAVPTGGDHVYTPRVPTHDPSDGMWTEAAAIPEFVAELTSSPAAVSILSNWRETVLAEVGDPIYRKILTAPFTDLLVGNGDSMRSFRPDQWPHSGLTFEAVSGGAHGDPSIRLIPTGYNELGDQMGVDSPVGGSGGLAHSGYGSAASDPANGDIGPYMNAYGSHQTWTSLLQNKELAVLLGLEKIQLNAGVQLVQTLVGGATGVIGGAVGGAGGAGLAMGASGSLAPLATAGISAQNAITMLDISNNGSFDIGAFQLGLSGMAAVTTFDTWYQSLFSRSGGGTPHRLASPWRAIVAQAFQAIVAIPSVERVRALLSEWRRYGYMIGQAFVPPRLDVMTHWSFWQLTDATILGSLPQSARETVAAAFERGVTVWSDVGEIGTEPANEPIPGVTY